MPKKTKLSPREREIYEMLVNGLSRKEMHEKLFITKNTLASHIVHIFQKKDVKNRVELVKKHYEDR